MAGYTVRARRARRWWALYVPELDEATQARRASEIERMARDPIHIHTGQPPEAIALVVEFAKR